MDLRSIDLNLLVVFDALMCERSVTRAAERLRIGQPAASHALARLRGVFDDPLLVRGAAGRRMEPTERALALHGEVVSVLADLNRLFSHGENFDPATAKRRFRIRSSDLIAQLFLPRLVAHLRAVAPGIALDIVHLNPADTVETLRTGAVEMAISTALDGGAAVASTSIAGDRMVALVNATGEAARGPWTLETFLDLAHLKVALSPADLRFVDGALAARGLTRRVEMTVPHWLLVPDLVAASDLVATVPERFARALQRADVITRPLPFETDAIDWRVYWHLRSAADEGLIFVREQLVRLAGEP
ncbi:MAG: LysR family transcriptional regulator [Pseudomonadota bacterium]